MSTQHDTLREELAALAHEQWAGWMAWMLPRMTEDTVVERWRRQMQTPYADLSEQEKQSDRAEADKVLALLPEAVSGERDALREAMLAEYCAILEHAGPWGEFGYQPTKGAFRLGGREALERVARSLGVLPLHDMAADRVAQRSTQR